MARKKRSKCDTLRKRYRDLNDGSAMQFAKEVTSIPAYAMRELTGQPHNRKPKCTWKNGWFE